MRFLFILLSNAGEGQDLRYHQLEKLLLEAPDEWSLQTEYGNSGSGKPASHVPATPRSPVRFPPFVLREVAAAMT
jgi:hypothetical protein